MSNINTLVPAYTVLTAVCFLALNMLGNQVRDKSALVQTIGATWAIFICAVAFSYMDRREKEIDSSFIYKIFARFLSPLYLACLAAGFNVTTGSSPVLLALFALTFVLLTDWFGCLRFTAKKLIFESLPFPDGEIRIVDSAFVIGAVILWWKYFS